MYRAVLAISRAMAILGGLVLTALVIMTCVSVAGRSLNKFFKGDWAQTHIARLADWMIEAGVAPILGDVELVEAGVGFAVFAFLPLCQISGAHAKVDIFTSRLGARANRVLQAGVEVVFAAVLVVIAWRLQVGLVEKAEFSETSFLLQFPIWWGSYPAILKGWIDRVLSYGFAYGRYRTLPPKAAMYSVTTGGAANEAEAVEYRERVDGLAEDVFGYLGWQVLPPSICHGPANAGAQARQQMLDDFENHLRKQLVVGP